MARVLSALALLPIVIATIWWLPWWATLVLAEIVVVLAFAEYARLVARLGARFPVAVTGSESSSPAPRSRWVAAKPTSC